MLDLALSGLSIDRCAERRGDDAWVAKALDDPATRFVPVWRDCCLIHGESAGRLTRDQVTLPADGATLLGADGDTVLFAIRCDDSAQPDFGARFEWAGLREIPTRLPHADAALLAYARAMITWQEHHRFCGVCGSPAQPREAGSVMRCTAESCGRRGFPRLDPAIIVLVSAGANCLLGRQANWPGGRFSTIAGFVEPGESFEDAVRREVREETDIDVGDCRYFGSQPWPFPSALMVGFHASSISTTITCNDGELAEARWVSRASIAAGEITLPPRMSIAYRLIEAWYDRHDGPNLDSLRLPDRPLRARQPRHSA